MIFLYEYIDYWSNSSIPCSFEQCHLYVVSEIYVQYECCDIRFVATKFTATFLFVLNKSISQKIVNLDTYI